ncbi:hypothetical protein AM493_12640 [Flavobacterium akiainvivens]|uniref:Uncharacterized protein n=1 Tax=Flavobacterium akiainvivens TaxID=1202724 RepID=A0A0M9VIL4_9FLAO|nr:hypothetical protein [Flavobacterium akiainvivens]KOS06776.1 hypothetical protein AM493_12640 [Flavobacterium akiainvivens]SFQ77126.1 hypothetical protein SAMN05444144_12520 [Flavobacterium akiainvivens]
MKKALIIVCAGLFLGFGKPGKAEFYFALSTYKHSEGLDQTVYDYRLDGNKLTVTSHWLYADSAFERLYAETISPAAIAKLKSVNLDALGDEYINNCISATEGAEYKITTGYHNDTKSVYLYHYYKEEIEKLVAELNKLVPEKNKIDYVGADTEQDCN